MKVKKSLSNKRIHYLISEGLINGPVGDDERKCTDLIWLCLFITAIVLAAFIGSVSFFTGN